jgi:hypothetical protein
MTRKGSASDTVAPFMTARVAVLPNCDFCMRFNVEETARYDAMTVYGPWANMCQTCFDMHGTGVLGLGKGQRLEEEGEVIGHA